MRENFFNIDDELLIRGEVKMINNSTKSIIFEKHNMIVDNGRNVIRDLFLKNIINFGTGDIISLVDFDKKGKISYLVFGSGNVATTRDMDTLNAKKYSVRLIGPDSLNDTEDITSNCSVSREFNSTDNKLTYTIDLQSIPTSGVIQELGLYFKDGTLFSRLAFDPIPVGPDTNITLEYSICF